VRRGEGQIYGGGCVEWLGGVVRKATGGVGGSNGGGADGVLFQSDIVRGIGRRCPRGRVKKPLVMSPPLPTLADGLPLTGN